MLKIKSLFEYFITEKISLYTKQTVLSLFRTLIETVIDSRNDSLVIYKTDDNENYQGVLNRLIYTNSAVFTLNQDTIIENIVTSQHLLKPVRHAELVSASHDYAIPKQVRNDVEGIIEPDLLQNINILKTEEKFSGNFLLIYSDRFSVVFVWEKSDTLGFYKAVCSLNSEVVRNFYDYIYKISPCAKLDTSLSNLKLDRRGNLLFDIILNKLLNKIEDSQRDLICAGTELKEHQKSENEDFKKVLKIYSHELRNPMGMMGVYAKIIQKCVKNVKDGNINNVTLDSLDSAARITQKAIDNVEALLYEMSNYSSELEINPTNEKMYNILNDTIDFVLPSFKDKNIILNGDISKIKNIKLNIDKHKIYQVLLNLLKNALETSKTHSQTTILSGISENKLFIEVQDTGCGISEKNQEKIFTPFFTTKKKGSGIGLSLSRKIIEAHNGRLILKETGANGSVFRIELPL